MEPREFNLGSDVWVRCYLGAVKWKKGVIIDQVGAAETPAQARVQWSVDGNVFEDAGFCRVEAANLVLRSELMTEVRLIILGIKKPIRTGSVF